ncbi:hypothetical protein EV586_103593 [Tumebacillus sp. BK434]|uniref:hypothetical protein n=1 Tax=Tumebacillus sp. BK434 TaxID=2512169 RepID=UPI0010531EE7|nr:hypothetical protein [Tumebacillus sp. BK434]TCP55934.1 hypothetical protein EV586_103593 [Tumebacillus sp. BK434]
MKKNLVTAIALSVVLGAGVIYSQVGAADNKAFTASGEQQAKLPELFIPGPGQTVADKIDFQVTAKVDNVPGEAQVFKFKKINFSRNEVLGMAAKLGMKGQVREQAESLGVEDGNKFLEVEKNSGKIIFLNREHMDQKLIDGQAKQIPSDEQAIQYATAFLKQLNWLQDDFQVMGVTENREIAGNLNPETDKGSVLSKTVHLYKHVNGKPVLGVSRITVEVGHQGEIEAVRKYHKVHEGFQKYKLKPMDQAIQELKGKKGMITIEEGATDAILEQVELTYWEEAGPIEEQPFMQPVYFFKGKYKMNGKDTEFTGVVPAVDNGFVLHKEVLPGNESASSKK